MKKNYLILIALVIGMMVGATSCKKKNVNPSSGDDGSLVTKQVETEDGLNVKTQVETFVYDAETPTYYYTAVKTRLENRVSTFNDSTTKVIIVTNNAVPSLGAQDYTNIYLCYKNGGNIVVCVPTLHNYMKTFREGILNAAYKEDVLKYDTEGFTEDQWVKYVGSNLFTVESGTQVSNGGMIAYSVGFHKGHKYILNVISDESDELDITNYEYGIMADGVVQWINDTQNDEKLTFKSFAGKGNDLTDLAEAEIQTNEYKVKIKGQGHSWSYNGVVQNILTTYTSHSFDDNRDWYQVDQSITFRNKRTGPVPGINNHTSWWGFSDIVYIFSLHQFKPKMWLSIPQGSTVIYESHPNTENGSMSSSYSTSEGFSHSFGSSMGFSLGAGSKGFTGSFSQNFSNSWTTSYQTTTGKSYTINDLSVTKNTVNESGYEKVKWDYKLRDTYYYKQSSKGSGDDDPTEYNCWWAAPLAITDCPQQNSILFYVDNPLGAATVNCENSWTYDFSWIPQHNPTDMNHEYTDGSKTTTFTLSQPDRYKERWGISCVDYGDITGDADLISMFEQRITNDIIGGASNKFNDVGGVDEYDNAEANSLLNLFINDFAVMAESYAQSGFTGTYKFRLQSVDTHRIIEKTYTIE